MRRSIALSLLVASCHAAPATKGSGDAGNMVAMTSNAAEGVTSAAGDLEHGGPWTIAVPAGEMRVAVDTVGASAPEEHSWAEINRLAQDPGDGFPAFTLSIDNSSPHPRTVRWVVAGEGKHPAGPDDLEQLTGRRPRADGRFPSGRLAVAPGAAAEIEFWAPQDGLAEGCETFRLALLDGDTGQPLLDRRGAPVIAHGRTFDAFPRGDEPADPRCAGAG